MVFKKHRSLYKHFTGKFKAELKKQNLTYDKATPAQIHAIKEKMRANSFLYKNQLVAAIILAIVSVVLLLVLVSLLLDYFYDNPLI